MIPRDIIVSDDEIKFRIDQSHDAADNDDDDADNTQDKHEHQAINM